MNDRERLQVVIRKEFEKGWKGVLPLLPYYADACEEAGHLWEAETARLPWEFTFKSRDHWISAPGEFSPKRKGFPESVIAFSLWGIDSYAVEVGGGANRDTVELFKKAIIGWPPRDYNIMYLEKFLVWFFGEEKGREHFRLHTAIHGDPEGVRCEGVGRSDSSPALPE